MKRSKIVIVTVFYRLQASSIFGNTRLVFLICFLLEILASAVPASHYELPSCLHRVFHIPFLFPPILLFPIARLWPLSPKSRYSYSLIFHRHVFVCSCHRHLLVCHLNSMVTLEQSETQYSPTFAFASVQKSVESCLPVFIARHPAPSTRTTCK